MSPSIESAPFSGDHLRAVGTATFLEEGEPGLLSVVLPVYNEASILRDSLGILLDRLAGLTPSLELVVVDDGSTDESGVILHEVACRDGRLRPVSLECNRGKGAAVRAGLARCRGEWILMSDADLSTDPDCASALLEALSSGAGLAVGSRRAPGAFFLRRQPMGRELLGRGFSHLANALFGLGISDLTCGFKALHRSTAQHIIERCVIDGWAFDVEWTLCARELGLPVVEVPVSWTDKPHSKVRLGSAVSTTLTELARMWLLRTRGAYVRPAPARGLLYPQATRYLPMPAHLSTHDPVPSPSQESYPKLQSSPPPLRS